jgi:hypothetical protein
MRSGRGREPGGRRRGFDLARDGKETDESAMMADLPDPGQGHEEKDRQQQAGAA